MDRNQALQSPKPKDLDSVREKPFVDTIGSGNVTYLPRKPKKKAEGVRRYIIRKGSWTPEEDDALLQGHRKYGFKWTKIASDESLHLQRRSGNNCRDRFRLKYPQWYGEPRGDHSDMNEHKVAKIGEEKSSHALPTEAPLPQELKSSQQYQDEPNDCSWQSFDEPAETDKRGHTSGGENRLGPPSTTPLDGIMSLLNDPDGAPYEGWDDNVTLPPLQWEDMATRPMFDLE